MNAARAVAFAVALAVAAPTAADPTTLEEVTVTARKLVEALSDVPLSLQALDRQQLERGSVQGLYSLAARAPGLSFESVWGGGVSLPTMRGQFSASLGDTVGVFVDGVHQASRSALDVEMLDFERVEVVHGPQGTLFGHSTFAGAIGYVSARPTVAPSASASVELGSAEYSRLQAVVSGPVAHGWLGRLAAGRRGYGGSGLNETTPGDRLGGYDRRALAATLATAPDAGQTWDATLSGRYEDSRFEHPPATAVEGDDYNCGSRDPASGLWSYFCGPLPTAGRFDISAGLPDSETRVGQAALKLALERGALRLESDTSWYDAHSQLVRDFDSSSVGVRYGVCTVGTNCSGPAGVPRLVDRFAWSNEVARDLHEVREVSQEFRLRGGSPALAWMLGAMAFDMRELLTARFGVARDGLAANQRLTALLPATPQVVGPVSIASLALVEDPNRKQVVRQQVENRQRGYALFGTAEHAPTERWRLRGELRASWERLELDSRVVNFQSSFGKSIAPQEFDDVNARFSADYRLTERQRTYASAARGSRSGGINPVPGLPSDEQSHEPETNWTYELGWRYRDDDWLQRLEVTAYYIDWADTQLNGLPARPGLNNLIVVNTAGIVTRGAELSAALALLPGVGVEFAWSYADPSFRAGSDDYGSSAFCGITPQVSTSTFCTVGPPREQNANNPALVPYLDGNAPGRAPRVTWHASLTAEAPRPVGRWRPWLRLDANHQDDGFERQINGARFGERTVFDARAGANVGRWTIEAWVLNLADAEYVRASFSRLPILYPTQPRPLDLISADGRRYGVTVRVAL